MAYDQSYGNTVYYNGRAYTSGAVTPQAQGVWGPGTPNAGQGWDSPYGGSWGGIGGSGAGAGTGLFNSVSNALSGLGLGTGAKLILLGGLGIVVFSFAMNHRSERK